MHDLLIRGATVVAGFGHDPFRADVAVTNGRIAATSGVSVPVPGAANTASGLIGTHFETEFTQAMDRVEAADPGADDDRVKLCCF